MSTILDTIAAHARERVAADRLREPLEALRDRCAEPGGGAALYDAVRREVSRRGGPACTPFSWRVSLYHIAGARTRGKRKKEENREKNAEHGCRPAERTDTIPGENGVFMPEYALRQTPAPNGSVAVFPGNRVPPPEERRTAGTYAGNSRQGRSEAGNC